MDWENMRRSDNVEDQRGRSGFGGRGAPLGLGLGGLVVVVILSALFGVNPLYLFDMLQEGDSPPHVAVSPPADDRQAEFVRAVLGDTEDVWGGIFHRAGTRYDAPKLTLFTGRVQSACGLASAAVGISPGYYAKRTGATCSY
jgi:predicted metalloprotease